MKAVRSLFFAIALATSAAAAATELPARAVFQISEGERQMKIALFAARRDLKLDPAAKIEFVVWNDSVRFLVNDPLFDDLHAAVRELVQRGVVFKVCADSLRAHNPERAAVLPQVKVVPSGTLEVARLQQRGYAYVRP